MEVKAKLFVDNIVHQLNSFVSGFFFTSTKIVSASDIDRTATLLERKESKLVRFNVLDASLDS